MKPSHMPSGSTSLFRDTEFEVQASPKEASKGIIQDSPEAQQTVSFYAELPADLQLAMRGFIERYPNWDQYRLIKAALAGFLIKNGVNSRSITRLYIKNSFSISPTNEKML